MEKYFVTEDLRLIKSLKTNEEIALRHSDVFIFNNRLHARAYQLNMAYEVGIMLDYKLAEEAKEAMANEELLAIDFVGEVYAGGKFENIITA
jgi:hypothetical protein